MLRPILLSTALLAVPAVSQCFYAPDNSAGTGTCNVIPFGDPNPSSPTWGNQIYQSVLTAADLNNTRGLVTGLAFAPCSSGDRVFQSLKITMAHIQGPMTATFATNLGANPIVVLDVRDFSWPQTADTWNMLPLAVPFPYDPAQGDLVVEILAMGVGQPNVSSAGMHRGDRQRLYATGWAGTPPASGSTGAAAAKMSACINTAGTTTFGRACASSAGPLALSYSGTSQLGQVLNVDMANGRPSFPAFAITGTTIAPPFPIDLAGLGAPGCFLHTDQLVVLATATSGTGTATIPLPIPNNPTLMGLMLFNQYGHLDPLANTLGFAFSNGGWFAVGN